MRRTIWFPHQKDAFTGRRGWQPAENSLKWGEVTCSLRPFYICAYSIDKNPSYIFSKHKSLTFASLYIKWKYRVSILTLNVFVSSRRAGLCYIPILKLLLAQLFPIGMAAHFLEIKQFKCAGEYFFCALFIINSKTLKRTNRLFKINYAKMWYLSGSVPVCSYLRSESRFCRLIPRDEKFGIAPNECYVLRHRKVPACATSAENDVVWQVIT